ncbi:DUF2252 domain-containing protein [Aestuariimicrobium sp. T2.26MG-19.2B]|uniref:DUF2252 domain-containing protein n=1 Tax=Aestuariimicrobium sp. T2.26MG-19.2B TaxID=3040679 RepID=UPI0024773161|nr:DUF2252 domain-containing protein [Aestuariimicrobium sp. T2.26MG-19.2B]CAI9406398.1 hypothetical protein AESSP_01618 [Aestuariimicrobium sp. T2.26MG-19.2B]
MQNLAQPSSDYFSIRRMPPARTERLAWGKSRRQEVKRSELGAWRAADDRPDPVQQIIDSHVDRIEWLIPLRVQRMIESPFGFLRGASNVCAWDCASLPSTGIQPVICGDAHLGNFGFYRSPEGELVIDLNDFDEAHPGAWEWDLRRLTASVHVAGRQNGHTEAQCEQAVFECVAAYRDELRHLAQTPLLSRAFARLDVTRLTKAVKTGSLRDEVARATTKARRQTSDRSLPKLTEPDSDGTRHLVENTPTVRLLSPARFDQLAEALDQYLTTLPEQWARVVGGYRLVDMAHKVVGVGSVGLRAFVALLEGSSPDDVLFLQLKQARRSVVAPFVHGTTARHQHQGQRVVEYQHALQTASDPLLGWCSTGVFEGLTTRTRVDDEPDGAPAMQFYVRQYRNMKGAVVVDGLKPAALADYAQVLGLLLAKGHARTSGASLIAGYIGRSDALPQAFTQFARGYADQTEIDHAALVAAVKAGRLPS